MAVVFDWITQSVSAFQSCTSRTGSTNSTDGNAVSAATRFAGIRARIQRKSPLPNAPRTAGPEPAATPGGMPWWPIHASIASGDSPGKTTTRTSRIPSVGRSWRLFDCGTYGPVQSTAGSVATCANAELGPGTMNACWGRYRGIVIPRGSDDWVHSILIGPWKLTMTTGASDETAGQRGIGRVVLP